MADRRDPFSLDGVHEDGARRGPWRIEFLHVSEEDAKFAALRAAISGSGRGACSPGAYVGLLHEHRGIVMSNTPDEERDHLPPWLAAQRRGGRVLIHGLGLGMVALAILRLPNVEHVDVVEIDEDVIELCGPPIIERAEGRLTIHHDDAFTRQWPVGVRWSVVWHDVWDVLNGSNLSDEEAARPGTYAKLNRRFARRCDWQGAWGQEFLRAERRRYAGFGYG